jgi:hypothetical protein
MSTRQLIDALERRKLDSNLKLEPLMKLASKNKVLLQLLIVLDIKGFLREEQEKNMRRTDQAVKVLSNSLKDSNHAFFKFVKPVSYVPSDIDILVSLDESDEVVKKIWMLGYRIVVKEPYCVTLVKGESIVDVYAHPTIGGVAYMDGEKLLEHVRTTEFNGLKIRTLEEYAEALMAAAHAVYKEKLYTLNDYFIVKKWATQRSVKLAEELNCEEALKLALAFNQKIENDGLNPPYNIPTLLWLKLLLQKLTNDKLTRATSSNIFKAIRDQRSGNLLTSKLTRETY